VGQVDSKTKTIALLSSTTVASLAAGTTSLYTVPSGFTAVITNICVHSASATLASVTSVSFGNNSATFNNWDSGRTLAAVSATTLAINLYPTLPDDSVTQTTTVCAEKTVFSMVVTTSATTASAVIDVFGYLY
jgi:hypothetical protein